MEQLGRFVARCCTLWLAVGCKDTPAGALDPIDTAAPTVSITAPVQGSQVFDAATIVVAATDDVGVVKVEFYVDGEMVHAGSRAPWEYTWYVRQLAPNSVHNIFAKAYDAANNTGTSPTISVSITHAPEWTRVGSGLGDDSPLAFAISDRYLFVGIRVGGVFRSSDDGMRWTPANDGLSTSLIWSLLADGGNLYAGTNGEGVFLSTDQGASWTRRSSGLTKPKVLYLGALGGNLFAATHFGGTYPGGVFRSTDNGVSWAAAGLQDYNVPALAVSGTRLFAGTSATASSGGGGVFLSTDSGTTWTPVNRGLSSLEIAALVISGSNLLAATAGGIYISRDHGTSWTAVNTRLTNAFCFTAHGNTVFAGTLGEGVFLSTDGGVTWHPFNFGLTNLSITALVVKDAYLFAGAGPGGVWRRRIAEVISS